MTTTPSIRLQARRRVYVSAELDLTSLRSYASILHSLLPAAPPRIHRASLLLTSCFTSPYLALRSSPEIHSSGCVELSLLAAATSTPSTLHPVIFDAMPLRLCKATFHRGLCM